MVRFKDEDISGEDFLVISNDGKSLSGRDTRLRVYRSLIGQLAGSLPKLTNPFHQPIWSCKFDEPKAPSGWKLQSGHHYSCDKIAILPTLGRRIFEGKAEWDDTVDFVGEFCYRSGYWEWTEDILSRCGEELRLEHHTKIVI